MTESLLSALLEVQKVAPALPKDKTATIPTKSGESYQYRYTDLATIVEKVGPLLVEHGLVWTTWPTTNEHGQPALRYRMQHAESGEKEEDLMPLLLGDKVDSQGLGSAITYARRYALTAVLNLVADEDDDGHAASNGADRFTKPTDKQLKYLRSLITQSRAPKQTLRAMLDTVQAQDIEIADGWTERLGREQVSRLIELFKAGALPDPGAQDIPTDDPPPVAEPVGNGTDDLPWEPEPAA